MTVNLEEVIARRAEVLDAIAVAARDDPRVGAAFLVGSLASGTEDAYSDIDVVVLAQPGSGQSLLEARRTWPAQFGEVVLQLDSSWNVWSGASQVLTLLEGDLPLWVDMDIWPSSVPAIPRESRLLVGVAPEPIDRSLSELATPLKERHGLGQASENAEGVEEAASLAWRLKAIARGKASSLAEVRAALQQRWPSELQPALASLRRYADHLDHIAAL